MLYFICAFSVLCRQLTTNSAFKISTFFIVSLMTRKRMRCCLATTRNVKLRKSCRRPSSSSLRSALTHTCEWSSGNREWPTAPPAVFIHLKFACWSHWMLLVVFALIFWYCPFLLFPNSLSLAPIIGQVKEQLKT